MTKRPEGRVRREIKRIDKQLFDLSNALDDLVCVVQDQDAQITDLMVVNNKGLLQLERDKRAKPKRTRKKGARP